MTKLQSVYRVQKPDSTSGSWCVQVRVNGRVQSKSFADSKHGGKEKALDAATKFRNELLESLGLSARLNKPANPYPGVSRTESTREQGKYKRSDAYWQAYWTDATGKQRTQRFSIRQHGEEGARSAAIKARKHAEQSLAIGEDPFFIQPSSKFARLWRYMDFTKFLALLEDSALFFSNATRFEDPYEGALSKSNRQHRDFVLSRTQQEQIPVATQDSEDFAISCWYSATHESAAMWQLYAGSNDAIAIRTSFGKLRTALPDCIKIGLVKYADYNQQWISEQAPIHRFMYKRISFKHETELRAIIDLNDPRAPLNGQIVDGNYLVGLDLNRLITHVFVSPKSQDWYFDLVCKVCKRYGLKVQPIRSSLYDGPVA